MNENPYLSLAKHLGIDQIMMPKLKQYLDDEITYNELVRWQIKLYKKAYKELYGLYPIKGDFERILPVPNPVAGAKDVIDKMKNMGYEVFVLSSGLYFIVKEVMRYGIPPQNIITNDFLYDSDAKLSTLRISVKGDKLEAYNLLISTLKVEPEDTFYVCDNAFESKLIDFVLERGSKVFYAKKEKKIFELDKMPTDKNFTQFERLEEIPQLLQV